MNLTAPVMSLIKSFPEGGRSGGYMLKTTMEKISKDFGVKGLPFT
jgi:hypothetical protein